MKYNEKYDRYVTKGGLVYKYSKRQGKLILCKPTLNGKGYIQLSVIKPKRTMVKVHRLVYETFVGEIPEGYTIDHINTIRNDNRLENLRCVTHKENCNNPLTKKHIGEAHKGKTHTEETKKKISKLTLNKPKSEFGEKYFEHFGYCKSENPKLYEKERKWYINHNKKCRWEKE